MSDGDLERAIGQYSRVMGKPISPQWQADLREVTLPDGDEALAVVTSKLGWPLPRQIVGRPRPDQFPLLVHDSDRGWVVAQQWDGEFVLALAGSRAPLEFTPDQTFFAVELPDPLASDEGGAVAVFVRAILRRKQPLVIAGLATVFANLLTLATSLYSMQLYDRVIPLASYDTLLVLTVGVGFALVLDFCLRSLRAVLIEQEAQDIDAEVSEFFFARAQAIRLDARPPGVGTMAAQLRGLEQIRQVLSAGSLFMLADLPFAVFFILVIALIGGKLALVPILSLPIALGIAFLLSRIIRKGTDRTQVSGNRKNGMLVESLDASEVVKANRGGWFMMGRWNRLVREIHHYELPVKKAQAVAGSVFSMLQQTAYIAIMGWGAYLASTGEITTGALLACSIISGRINGPLVAQLPSLIVQWGYARSSLRALDEIMRLPLEPAARAGALRPDIIVGGFELRDVRFTYRDDAHPALDIEKLSIRPGERIAIIGGIGSGKSTLLKMLSGLYLPQEGRVLLGGLDLRQVAEDIARRHIGYVAQDSRLVNGTLRDNLIMGLGDTSDAQIMEAAEKVRLNALVASRADGLALPIQEGGKGLSGGQRSLVSITRLLLADPQIWLLDEPTAALDQNTEIAALDTIDAKLGKDKIMVMVTHKLPLLSRFTRIIAMSGGKIVRDGSTADVLRDLLPKAPPPRRASANGPIEGMVTTSGGGMKTSQ